MTSGKPSFDLRVVEDDAVVAGQRDLQAAAERRAVDRRDDRQAEGLQPAQLALDLRDVRKHARRGSSGVAWIRPPRSPPAKKVFLALVTTTPRIESFSRSSRSTVSPIEAT